MARKFTRILGKKTRYGRRRRRAKRYNALSAKIPNTKRQFRIKLCYSMIVTQQGVAGVNYPQIILPLNFPNCGNNDNGSGLAAYTYMGNIPNTKVNDIYGYLLTAAPLFDEYKVHSLKAQFIPNTIDVNINITTGTTNNFATSVYQFNDQDDITLLTPATIEQRMLNGGVRPKNYNITSSKGLNFIYKQRSNMKNIWLNTGLIANNAVITPTIASTYGSAGFPGMFGAMKLVFMMSAALATGSTLGRLFVTWDVSFKGINSVA